MIYCVFFFSGRIRHTICALVTGVHTCALPISGLLGGLEKYDSKLIRKRSSSPKFQVHNTALISAQRHEQFSEIRQRPDEWGHMVESAVGAHLINSAYAGGYNIHYWREGGHEGDFVLDRKSVVSGKSGSVRVEHGVRRILKKKKK